MTGRATHALATRSLCMQAAAGQGKELKEVKLALEKAKEAATRKDKLLAAETQRADCFQRVTETQKERVATLVARNKSLEVRGGERVGWPPLRLQGYLR